jgi:hypothetical protein
MEYIRNDSSSTPIGAHTGGEVSDATAAAVTELLGASTRTWPAQDVHTAWR